MLRVGVGADDTNVDSMLLKFLEKLLRKPRIRKCQMNFRALSKTDHAIMAELRGICENISLIGDPNHRLLHLRVQRIWGAKSMRQGDTRGSHECPVDVITFQVFDRPRSDERQTMFAHLPANQEKIVAGLG
jgi:hypothetical protein